MPKNTTPHPRRRNPKNPTVSVRGFWRVNIVERDEDGISRIVGDSDWIHNQITVLGLQNLAAVWMNTAGSSLILKGALGTGTVPATNATTLPGEFSDATGASSTMNRPNATIQSANTGGNSVNVSYLFTWASTTANGFATASKAIQNIGLYPSSNTSGGASAGTLFSGATYAVSTLSTNQDVLATYVIRFATA